MAKHRFQMKELKSQQIKESNLSKQDHYKETRIQLVANFIKLMKIQKMIRIYVIQAVLFKSLMILDYQCTERYNQMRVFFSSIFLAIKFKIKYKVQFQKKYGFDADHRNR